MSEPAHMERLSPCPKCGGENLAWCGISVRPYCRECGHWGRVNHGAANDAIEAWNSSASRAEANADMRRENRRLAAEVERLRAIEATAREYVAARADMDRAGAARTDMGPALERARGALARLAALAPAGEGEG